MGSLSGKLYMHWKKFTMLFFLFCFVLFYLNCLKSFQIYICFKLIFALYKTNPNFLFALFGLDIFKQISFYLEISNLSFFLFLALNLPLPYPQFFIPFKVLYCLRFFPSENFPWGSLYIFPASVRIRSLSSPAVQLPFYRSLHSVS